MPTHFNVDIYLNFWLEYIILSMNMWWHLCKIFVNVTCSIILLSWKCLNYIHDKAQVFTCASKVLCQSNLCFYSQICLHVQNQNVNMLVISFSPIYFRVIHSISKNILKQIHHSLMKKVYQMGRRPKQACVLGIS